MARHPQETLWFWLTAVWVGLSLLGGAGFMAAADDPTSGFIPLWAVMVALGIAVLVGRQYLRAQQRANAVLLSPQQFPDVYAMVAEVARDAGLDYVPEVYAVQGGGTLNAFASQCGHRGFVTVYADLLEVGTRLQDPQTLRFILAHEVGHIAAGHTNVFQSVIGAVAMLVPPVGFALSRAREYTADNFGYVHAPGGAAGMVVLAGGKYLYRFVDPVAMAARSRTQRGFWVFLVNLFATHPIMVKRMAALLDRSKPGEIF